MCFDNFQKQITGRRSCEISIPDPTLFQAQPCPKDLVAYLEVKYECVKVTFAEPTLCNNQPIHIDSSSGYISNQVTTSLGVGSARCPWHLEALPGQRFSISLLDFTTPKASMLQQYYLTKFSIEILKLGWGALCLRNLCLKIWLGMPPLALYQYVPLMREVIGLDSYSFLVLLGLFEIF